MWEILIFKWFLPHGVSYDSKAKMSRKISTLDQDAQTNFNPNKSAQNYSNLKSKWLSQKHVFCDG